MKKQVRFGFTIVELLVVISIIGMLAGLLLPAINAAREAGRRATCMANQSQVGLALLNYDNARGAFPPMRSGKTTPNGTVHITWAGHLLPLMEYNTMWDALSNGQVSHLAPVGTNWHNLSGYPLPLLKCTSAAGNTSDSSMNYVVNGGYQNAFGEWANATKAAHTIADTDKPFEPNNRSDAVFFDHLAYYVTGPLAADTAPCTQTVSIDFISTRSGTSYTLLLSENIDAGKWTTAGWTTAGGDKIGAGAEDESLVAFCFPFNQHVDLKDALGASNTAHASYGLPASDATCSWKGYDISTTNIVPFFINVGRGDTSHTQYRRARPSSNHPGMVVATFADRSARTLNENIHKHVFVHLCRPNSGEIINPGDL